MKRSIPKEWKLTKLGRVLPKSYKNGIYKSAEHYGNGTSILRINDFDNQGNLTSADLQKLHLDENEIRHYSLNFNDIVVNRVNSLTHIGKSILWGNEEIIVVYESNMMRIEPDDKRIKPEFLIQLLHDQSSRNFFRRVAKRAVAQSSINQQDVKALPIYLPPLSEQKAIADLLSTWDEAIEKTERLILVKEASLKGQIQKLIRQRCDSWLHIKPKKIFDTITEKNFPDEELLSVTQNRGVIPRSMLEGRVMSPDGTTASYKLIKRGDFAISLRSFQGGIEYSDYQGIISPAYTVLRPKIELNSDFYRLFFKSYIFIEKYLNLAVIGIRDGKQISIPDFLSIKIPVPPLEEQKEIAETLSVCQHEIDLLKQLADKYQTQKHGLMQKMLTGEWRVKPEIVRKYMEV